MQNISIWKLKKTVLSLRFEKRLFDFVKNINKKLAFSMFRWYYGFRDQKVNE